VVSSAILVSPKIKNKYVPMKEILIASAPAYSS
jgi:hypothetical protein